jgi:hypothetical protein
VTEIEGNPFEGTPWFDNQPNGLIYFGAVAYKYKGFMNNTEIAFRNGTSCISDSCFINCYRLTSVTIPNSVTSIGKSAFEKCTGLTSATIGNSVTSIGESAFEKCTGLTSVTIGASVISIGKCAFYECSKLSSITIPNSVTSIGTGAFYECSKLSSITIPNSVASIGEYAFDYTPWLKNQPYGLVYAGLVAYTYKETSSIPDSTSITLRDGTKGIAGGAFRNINMTTVYIPNSVTSIGSRAFDRCTSLKTITIPDSVTSIGSDAFDYCSGLTSVTIGKSVTNISFHDSDRLTRIESKVSNPGTLGIYVPSGVYSTATLVVPPGSSYLYRCMLPWSKFHSIFDDFGIHATCDTIKYIRGEQTIVDLPLSMSNEDAVVTAIQMDVILPSFVELTDVTIDPIRNNGHSVEVKRLSSGKYRILVSSIISKPLRGSEGSILHLWIKVLKRTSSKGDHRIDFDNILLSSPSEIESFAEGFSHPIRIYYLLGDANADVTVDVADFVVTANRIMGRTVEPYFSDAANVNKDNTVNVTDLVGITNIALGINPQTLCYAPPINMSSETIATEGYTLTGAISDGCMLINVSNDKAIAGMQIDLSLPSGVFVEGVECLGRAHEMEVQTAELSDGRTTRLLLASFGKENIAAGDGNVLKLILGGRLNFENNIDIVEALFTERNLTEHIPLISISGIGVNGLSDFKDNEVNIWAEKGSIVIESDKTCVAQIVELDGTVQSVDVKPGVNVYPTDRNGVAIVKVNGNTVKVMRR